MATFSERIVELMQIRGIKQADISRSINVSRATVSDYVSGNKRPRPKVMARLSKVYDVDQAWLYGFDVPMNGIVNNENTELLNKWGKLNSEQREAVNLIIDNFIRLKRRKK